VVIKKGLLARADEVIEEQGTELLAAMRRCLLLEATLLAQAVNLGS
jgi:hypothetical protein